MNCFEKYYVQQSLCLFLTFWKVLFFLLIILVSLLLADCFQFRSFLPPYVFISLPTFFHPKHPKTCNNSFNSILSTLILKSSLVYRKLGLWLFINLSIFHISTNHYFKAQTKPPATQVWDLNHGGWLRYTSTSTLSTLREKKKNYNTQTHTETELKHRMRGREAFMESPTVSVKNWDYWRAWLNIWGSKRITGITNCKITAQWSAWPG